MKVKKMKIPTEEIAELLPEEWAELSNNIKLYNEYVMERIKLIMDFDVWYEMSTSKDFPKKWYSMVKETAIHK